MIKKAFTAATPGIFSGSYGFLLKCGSSRMCLDAANKGCVGQGEFLDKAA
jgi:hypothetical protein